MKKIRVFYSDSQSVDDRTLFSPSVRKPRLVMVDWYNKQAFPVEVLNFNPVTAKDLHRVHDKRYVNDVLKTKRQNGFGSRSKAIAQSLLWTSGSMVAATLDAMKTGSVAVSPTSGFHHAGYFGGGGFCTFNGLMLAALKAFDAGAKKVAILDLDQHYGNGTDSIINELRLKNKVAHWTLGSSGVNTRNAHLFIDWLPGKIEQCFAGADVLIYQAGADCHKDDPLGGRFTTEQMFLRDRAVFQTAKRLGLPVAWNLAGGYQDPVEKVVAIHRNTMMEAIDTYLS